MKHLVFFLFLAIAGMRSRSQWTGNELALASAPTPPFNLSAPLNSDGLESSTLESLLSSGRWGKAVLGYSKKQRPIEVYYFPGTSGERAMVIGGVHGSELSAIELAHRLIKQLSDGERPFFSVIIIPSLFPDNRELADDDDRKGTTNVGRYSSNSSADPNRQMPALGKAFDPSAPLDACDRKIEWENQLLLRLIQEYGPRRVINLHAIRDMSRAGVYADPRTDCTGEALGYEKDSLLATSMACFITKQGGKAPGNFWGGGVTALYFHDPAIAEKGSRQARNLHGSPLPANRGYGVSLGSWATTAVCDGPYAREAMQLITLEFPGYRPVINDPSGENAAMYALNQQRYAEAVLTIFLARDRTTAL